MTKALGARKTTGGFSMKDGSCTMTSIQDSLLLVLPALFKQSPSGELLIESQACNGIDRWAENFPHVIVACVMRPASEKQAATASVDYLPAADLTHRDRVELIPLPYAYRVHEFIRAYAATRELISQKITEARYLFFAIGGLVGDWGSVAALEALRLDRRYAAWTDSVSHLVIKTSYLDASGVRRWYRYFRDHFLYSPLMKIAERYVISKADLGLFNGEECFRAFSSYSKEPHVVHDIHLTVGERIPKADLEQKIRRMGNREPVKFIYAGRVAALKGPFEWINVMAGLRSHGLEFHAVWLGDGPLLADARAEIDRLQLNNWVSFAGHVADRVRVLDELRSSDLFVFCHKTPESPRCLIEALMSGTPIAGYHSPYPEALLGDLADALLSPPHDPAALIKKILVLAENRVELARHVRQCDVIGSRFSDQAVFAHRSDLIKKHLG